MATNIKTIISDRLSPTGEDCSLIKELVHDFCNMESARSRWEDETNELISYLDATDTRTTTNNKLPFKNSTTIPKLSSLYNDMNTVFMDVLMPNADWVDFKPVSFDDMTMKQRKAVSAYVKTKATDSNLEGVMEKLGEDIFTSGIAVAHTRYVRDVTETVEGFVINNYTGAVTERISPKDFFYDMTASSLKDARKCVRTMYTLGSLKKEIEESSNPTISMEQFAELHSDYMTVRNQAGTGYTWRKNFEALAKQGFGDVLNYINEGLVEVLRFYGDFYDFESDQLLTNYEITIINRKMIGSKRPIDSWNNSQSIHAYVWEFRKGTLAPIGPLNRVVGLQYKLDKRENLKEDLFDRFVSPTLRKTGDVTEKGVRGGPNHEFVIEEGGDVGYLVPPAEVLQPDNQLGTLLSLMDELTGRPKEAIGQRTPGEKTAFEVQLLDGGQMKPFLRKMKKFEREFLSPILNDYLALGRENFDAADVASVFNDELGMEEFIKITPDILNSQGKLQARGASLYIAKSNALQTLNNISNTNLGQILNPHISRTKLMRVIEYLTDLDEFDLFTFGIGVQEDNEVRKLAAKSNEQAQVNAMTQETTGQEAVDMSEEETTDE